MNHDSQSEKANEADALRSDIDQTRRRMDGTMDALGDRLQPRHLMDEVLGFFRGEGGSGDTRLDEMREKVTASANSAVHGVVDTVKRNPLPALVIGAGIAWMIYESRKKSRPEFTRYRGEDEFSGEVRYDPDVHFDRPLEYPTPRTSDNAAFRRGDGPFVIGPDNGHGSGHFGAPDGTISDEATGAGGMKEKMANMGAAAREKFSAARETAGEKLHAARERAAELGGRAREKAGAACSAARERVVHTAEHNPLEVGLCCLAAGLLAGLALPTPEKINQIAGPTADRLRERARQAGSEAMDKGKRVVRAAASAVKDEARAQGFTPERLREQAGAVAQRIGSAAGDVVSPDNLDDHEQERGERREENAGTQSFSSDPSSARPTA